MKSATNGSFDNPLVGRLLFQLIGFKKYLYILLTKNPLFHILPIVLQKNVPTEYYENIQWLTIYLDYLP